jgi:hypothetical protein
MMRYIDSTEKMVRDLAAIQDRQMLLLTLYQIRGLPTATHCPGAEMDGEIR